MLSRSHASPEQLQVPKAPEGLKTSARQIVLIGGLLGVATFALLPLVPGFQSGDSPPRIELSMMIAFAAGIFAATWFVVRAHSGNAVARSPVRARGVAAARTVEPALVSPPDAPLLMEMSDSEIVSDREGAGIAGARRDLAEVSFALSAAKEAAIETNAAPPTFSDVDALTARIKAHRPSGGGQRTMITSEVEGLGPHAAALELAKSLSDGGAQTILVDWSPAADGFARMAGLEMGRGFNDLIRGRATFDDIIQRLPGTRAHAIASGEALSGVGQKLDPDFLNLALDALDEAYDFIIVTGRHDEARTLFECIEGRFDAGVLVISSEKSASAVASAGMFLGFEVADIDILQYQRAETSAVSPIASRIALATRTREAVARQA